MSLSYEKRDNEEPRICRIRTLPPPRGQPGSALHGHCPLPRHLVNINCMLGTEQGTEDGAEDQRDGSPALTELTVYWGRWNRAQQHRPGEWGS